MEANGAPVLGGKDEGDTPALEATGRTCRLCRQWSCPLAAM